MTQAPRLCDGGTVVILATGPSLNSEGVGYCQGKADLVIAINDAHRLAPWADVLYSSDRYWWPYYKGVPSFTGLKFGIGSGVGKNNPIASLPEVKVLRNTGFDGIETDPGGLRNGKNSGYAAINLAVHLGAKRIVLLGYNLGTPGGQVHFFGNHPPRLPQNPNLYPGWCRRFQTMVEPLKTLGIEVLNCTANTSLNAFPKAELRDVLKVNEVAA